MSIRTLVRGHILGDAPLIEKIPEDFWLSSGSISEDNRPDHVPFAVMRYGVTSRGVGDARRIPLEIWVHDEPGTYGTIDGIIALLHGRLNGVAHLQDLDGNELMSADWVSDSGDLFDPGFRTIVKTTSYNLIGRGV